MSVRHVFATPRTLTKAKARRLKKLCRRWMETFAPASVWVECSILCEGRPLRFHARETR
jgi:hypothetical protein